MNPEIIAVMNFEKIGLPQKKVSFFDRVVSTSPVIYTEGDENPLINQTTL